jgi:hypothetical protein
MDTRKVTAVTALYALLTVVLAYPFSVTPGSTILDDAPDIYLYIWTLAWDVHALLHQPWAIFDANIYHPYLNTLAYSENLIGTSFLAAPVIWLTGNLVLAMNLAALATCVLCGTGAYLLGRSLGLGAGGAFLCGLIYAFAPPRFMKIGQLHMNAMQWIPFSLAYLHAYLDRGRRADLHRALGFGSLQALASGHGAVFLVVASIVVCGWRAVWGEPLRLWSRVRDVGLIGVALLLPVVWLGVHYRAAQRDAGLVRGYGPQVMPPLANFLDSPSTLHRAVQAFVVGRPIGDEATAYLFPGFLVLILAGLTLVPDAASGAAPRPQLRARLRTSVDGLYGTLAVVATLLFLPWPVNVWQYAYAWPGFSFIRIPARFVVLTLLALGVLAASSFERLTRGINARSYWRWTAVVAALLVAEYASVPIETVPFTLQVPAIDRWLATQPKPFVFAEAPVPRNLGMLERQQAQVMLHSTAHWQRTVHGYSGIRQPLHEELYRTLNGFPDEPSLTRLRELGVRYVVVHTEQYGPGVWPGVEQRLAAFPGLRLIHVEDDGRAYEILP